MVGKRLMKEKNCLKRNEQVFKEKKNWKNMTFWKRIKRELIEPLERRREGLQYLKLFEKSTRKLKEVQDRVLKDILQEQKNTIYGQEHHFLKIKTYEEFCEEVPLQTYDDMKKYIEKIKQGKQNILTKKRVVFFATSSGTTSEQKFIPVTKERLDLFRREFLLWSTRILSKHYRKVLKGKTLYFAAASLLGRTEARIPYGNITGYHVEHLPWYLKQKMVLPAKYYNISNVKERTKKIAIRALLEKNITQLAFAAPIEILLFLEYIDKNKEELLQIIKEKNKKRWKELQKLKEQKKWKGKYIWPNIHLISCITADINKKYLEQLYKTFGKKIPTREPGIYASEGRINIGVTKEKDAGVLVANTNFFEFQEMTNTGRFKKPIRAHEIQKGKQYKVRITTKEGLYRYDIGDIITVAGFKGKLPLIKYYDRDKYINIVGENLSTIAVIQASEESIKEERVEINNYVVCPTIQQGKQKPHYTIIIEENKKNTKTKIQKFLKTLDKKLQEKGKTYNKARNEFGRLDPISATIIRKKSFAKRDEKAVQKTGQAKPEHISKDPNYIKQFEILEEIKVKN